MTPRIDRMTRRDCWSCECSLDDVPVFFFPVHQQRRRGDLVITAPQVCPGCFLSMEAETEAQANGWRFSGVDFKEPCLCGRPSVAALGAHGITCVPCWRESKMLKAAQRSINQTKRVVALLRREAANV